MYIFDKEAYFTDAKLTYDTRGEIERVADEVSKQGFILHFLRRLSGSHAADSVSAAFKKCDSHIL